MTGTIPTSGRSRSPRSGMPRTRERRARDRLRAHRPTQRTRKPPREDGRQNQSSRIMATSNPVSVATTIRNCIPDQQHRDRRNRDDRQTGNRQQDAPNQAVHGAAFRPGAAPEAGRGPSRHKTAGRADAPRGPCAANEWDAAGSAPRPECILVHERATLRDQRHAPVGRDRRAGAEESGTSPPERGSMKRLLFVALVATALAGATGARAGCTPEPRRIRGTLRHGWFRTRRPRSHGLDVRHLRHGSGLGLIGRNDEHERCVRRRFPDQARRNEERWRGRRGAVHRHGRRPAIVIPNGRFGSFSEGVAVRSEHESGVA